MEAARVALDAARARARAEAWARAALEVERDLVCRSCKAGETKHSTCDRAVRFVRRFRGRAAALAPRGPGDGEKV